MSKQGIEWGFQTCHSGYSDTEFEPEVLPPTGIQLNEEKPKRNKSNDSEEEVLTPAGVELNNSKESKRTATNNNNEEVLTHNL